MAHPEAVPAPRPETLSASTRSPPMRTLRTVAAYGRSVLTVLAAVAFGITQN